MDEKKALAVSVTLSINAFIISVVLSLTLSASGLLSVLGFTAFTLQLIVMGARVYSYLLKK